MFALLGVFVSVFILWFFQDYFLYTCGATTQTLPPEVYGLPNLQMKGNIMFFERTNTNRNVFYFHGNGIRAENTWWHVGRLFQICNCSVYVMEVVYCRKNRYLPYTQHEIVTYLINDTYQYLRKGQDNIFMGVSLGTAHALNVFDSISNSKIQRIILENPFTSVPELLPWSFSLLLFKQWNNMELIKQVREQSLLILTSEKDEIVPPDMSHYLYHAAPTEHKEHVVLEGALHGHAGAHPNYLPAIQKFLGK